MNLDLYGKPVGVNIDGDSVIRTWPGACMSVVTILVIVYYILMRFMVMITYNQFTTVTLKEDLDLADASDVITFD